MQGRSKPPVLGHSAPSQAPAQRGAADATGTVPGARHSALGFAGPTSSHLPHKGARGGQESPARPTPHPAPGAPGPPPADPSPRGALTKMTRLKRIIMTLIKVKHPIFAPGESREVTGGPSPSTAAAPRVQGKAGGPHGRGGTEPDLPVRRAAPNTSPRPAPARCASAAPPVPPFMGRVPGPDPPPRPAPGATPGAAGSPQPCCPLLLSAAGCRRGTRSCPCSPCHGDGGRQRYQPRGCFSPSRRLQLWGHHPAALLACRALCWGFPSCGTPGTHSPRSQPPLGQPRLRHPIFTGRLCG